MVTLKIRRQESDNIWYDTFQVDEKPGIMSWRHFLISRKNRMEVYVSGLPAEEQSVVVVACL